MSSRFPSVLNPVHAARGAFLSLQIGALLLAGQLLNARTGNAQVQRRMPDVSKCVPLQEALKQVANVNLRVIATPRGNNDCPSGTVYDQTPKPFVVLTGRERVILNVSLGPQPTVTPTKTPTPTPVPATPTPLQVTSPTVTPIPPTETPTPTPSPTVTETPTPPPSPTPTESVSPTPLPTETVSPTQTPPCRTDDPNCYVERDWPWEWIILGFVLPISGIGGGQAARYLMWKKRIKVEASVDGPYLAWIGPLNPPADSIETRVKVFPGNVRFYGPIKVTILKRKNDK